MDYALAEGSKTLEFSIDGARLEYDLSFAATDLANLLVRGFEADSEKMIFQEKLLLNLELFKENSQESSKSVAVDLNVIVQPQADGASTSSVSSITPTAISQQDDILSLEQIPQHRLRKTALLVVMLTSKMGKFRLNYQI